MSKKEAYIQKLQAQLDEWGAEIKKLKAKAGKADADAKIEYHKIIEDLREKQDKAKEKMKELRQAGDEAWKDMKTGIENAWNNLSESVKSAISKFK
jgi:chromosome segregation ATPase